MAIELLLYGMFNKYEPQNFQWGSISHTLKLNIKQKFKILTLKEVIDNKLDCITKLSDVTYVTYFILLTDIGFQSYWTPGVIPKPKNLGFYQFVLDCSKECIDFIITMMFYLFFIVFQETIFRVV